MSKLGDSKVTSKWKVKLLAHGFGLACLLGAVFTEGFVFLSILLEGQFKAAEPNIIVLCLEIGSFLFGGFYLAHTFQTTINKLTSPKKERPACAQ